MSSTILSKTKARMLERIPRTLDEARSARYEPSGVQEDVIRAVGSGKYQIVYVSGSNKIGKTCVGANILRNIIWENDPEWFNYPLFRGYPFPKAGRIIGTPKNVSDTGPIRKELRKWLPKGAYEFGKGGKNYYSQYEAKNGAYWDVMTYEQATDEFEGPLLGWTWMDEPPPARLIGPSMTRFSKGGLVIITATPVGDNVGPFLDILDDLEANGARIARISCDILENSITDGKPNSKGTKRGLMTNMEIRDYISSVPRDEREARIYGKPNYKSGKIYREFNFGVHVRDIDISAREAKLWNCYLSIDPHRKGYPAVTCWAVTPDERYICFNEWPTRELLGAWYSDVRVGVVCPYTVEDLSMFLKAVDGSRYGLHVVNHIADPYYVAGTRGEGGKTGESLIDHYLPYGIELVLPPREKKAKQRETIRALLDYDPQRPLVGDNLPKITIASHCQNTIRMFERHYWNGDDEAEEYKDFSDTVRNFFAWIEGTGYKEVKENSWGGVKRVGHGVVSFDAIFENTFGKHFFEAGLR